MLNSHNAARAAPYVALILTTALWGSNGAVSRSVLETVPPMAMAILRWAVVLGLLAPLVWPERRAIMEAIGREWRALGLLALFGSAPQSALIYAGLADSTAIHLGLLNSTIPVLIILISWAFHGRRPRTLESAGLALSLAGVLLILAHGDLRALYHLEFNHGDLLMLLGMLTWAIYTLRLKDRPQALSLFGFVFILALFGCAMALPLALLERAHGAVFSLGMHAFLGLAYIGALPTLAGAVLFSYGVQHVGAVRAGILIHLMPVFAAIFAATFIGEELFAYHAAGFIMVAGGAILGCFRHEPVLSSLPSTRT